MTVNNSAKDIFVPFTVFIVGRYIFRRTVGAAQPPRGHHPARLVLPCEEGAPALGSSELGLHHQDCLLYTSDAADDWLVV